MSQHEARGADDPALLAQRHRGKRAAEITPPALPHFDHHQHLAVAAHEIELPASAAQVAREQRKPAGFQILAASRSAAQPLCRLDCPMPRFVPCDFASSIVVASLVGVDRIDVGAASAEARSALAKATGNTQTGS